MHSRKLRQRGNVLLEEAPSLPAVTAGLRFSVFFADSSVGARPRDKAIGIVLGEKKQAHVGNSTLAPN